MSYAHTTDLITGLKIEENERIVVVLIQPRRGGYPDATAAAAFKPSRPTKIFEPFSLPIRGAAGHFTMHPDADQDSVELVNRMTGLDLSKDIGPVISMDGIQPVQHPNTNPMFLRKEQENVVVGMAVFREANWDALMARMGERYGMNDDVSKSLHVIREGTALVAENFENFFEFAETLALRTNRTEVRGRDGEAIELPSLSKVLAHREGGDVVGASLMEHLDIVVRKETRKPPAEIDFGLLERLLTGLSGLDRLSFALNHLGRMLLPSSDMPTNIREENVAFVAGLALNDAIDDILRPADNGCELEIEDPQSVVEDLERIRESLDERIQRLRAVMDTEAGLSI